MCARTPHHQPAATINIITHIKISSMEQHPRSASAFGGHEIRGFNQQKCRVYARALHDDAKTTESSMLKKPSQSRKRYIYGGTSVVVFQTLTLMKHNVFCTRASRLPTDIRRWKAALKKSNAFDTRLRPPACLFTATHSMYSANSQERG